MDGGDVTSIFDIDPDAAVEARFDARAEADYEAGRVVPHAKVVTWLQSWATANALPCPTSEGR